MVPGTCPCHHWQCHRVPLPHATHVPFPAAPEKSVPELADTMQADGPRACRFGRRWYLNNESWHPSVPPFGEMKCILCWCVVSVPGLGGHQAQKKVPLCQFPVLRGWVGEQPRVTPPHLEEHPKTLFLPHSQGRHTASARSARQMPVPAPPGGTIPAAPSAAVSTGALPWALLPQTPCHGPCTSPAPLGAEPGLGPTECPSGTHRAHHSAPLSPDTAPDAPSDVREKVHDGRAEAWSR